MFGIFLGYLLPSNMTSCVPRCLVETFGQMLQINQSKSWKILMSKDFFYLVYSSCIHDWTVDRIIKININCESLHKTLWHMQQNLMLLNANVKLNVEKKCYPELHQMMQLKLGVFQIKWCAILERGYAPNVNKAFLTTWFVQQIECKYQCS